jgi:4-hydroxyphenylpyruvate dioxygenase-like putative hemolysin
MPRYYFDVRDEDGASIDEVGIELPDMAAAIQEARRAVADMVRDALRESNIGDVAIAIRDGADGPVVLSVSLSTVTPSGDVVGGEQTGRPDD